MIIDEHQTAEPDLRDVEAELCRLPDVVAVRIVADGGDRPVEVHVLAHTGKHPKQVVRDIQSVALASFGLDIDRRIVSVVQLAPDDEATANLSADATPRPRIMAVDSHISGSRITIRVSLRADEDEATGYAEGSVAAATRPRLMAAATIDALEQLGAVTGVDIEAAETVRVGVDDVALVTLVCVDPPYELRLCGSALVRQHADDATVRAVLDGVNRRLPHLAPKRDSS
jgi:hypothetical protein